MKFLELENIKQADFHELMSTTVVTQDKKVKFLSNMHDTLQRKMKTMQKKPASSLWERRRVLK